MQLASGPVFDADGGTWWSFTIGGGGPGFGKQTPAPGLSGLPSTVRVQWTPVPNEGYWVCWDQIDNGQCDTDWWPNGGQTWKDLENLAPGTYYWQVKTADVPMEADGGIWWAFTVGTPPVTFGKQTPAAGAILTTNAAMLWWDAAPGAQYYEVCVDTINNGLCDTQWELNGVAVSRLLAGLTDGPYYWQVRAQTATGPLYANVGAWWSVTVDAPDPIREYIYLGNTLLATVNLTTGTPVVSYYHTDALGSVRAITNATGALVGSRIDYGAFGETTAPLVGDPRKYIGGEVDPETAFEYLGARYYRNVWGRFTSLDPIVSAAAMTNPQLWNRYAYGLNSPLRFSDPSGMAASAVDLYIQADYGGANREFDRDDFAQWVSSYMDYQDTHGNRLSLFGSSSQDLQTLKVKGATKKQEKAVIKAVGEAATRLENPACAGALGGKSAATAALMGTTYSFGNLGRAIGDSSGRFSVLGAGIDRSQSPAGVIINTNGPFINQTVLADTPFGTVSHTFDFGSNLRGQEFGALLLLHEVGHLTGVFDPDATNYSLNLDQTQKVLNACFAKRK